jgi:hypothetical protein
MKKLIGGMILIAVMAPGLLLSQDGENAAGRGDTMHYTVGGYRHGVSFFPQVKYPCVEYVPHDKLTFDKYHSTEVITYWMERWAAAYPDIVTLYEIGKSYEGRSVLQMTVTNKNTGADTDKPAAFFEGNRHSGEITAAESVLWLAQHLIEGYGKDTVITDMVDHFAIYLRPMNNPDGRNLYLNTAQSNRSTVRPYDSDSDGLLDEDPPEDIDGNGYILVMRWPDRKNGNMIPDPADSTGRIMKRVPRGQGIYSTAGEGIDNDGDGRINEDGIGGLDLHRNYPENWRPETEFTGRGFTQQGAGEYPLSEPETRAVFAFLMAHPNVYVVNSMDTAVPMHLRPPSTSPSAERMYPEDLKWYRYFDEAGKRITGYEKAGDVYDDYGSGQPLFGHGPDFGYWYFGAIWYGDELWNGARGKDYDSDGDTDQIDMLAWDENENNGEGFIEWTPVKHPVYDSVETGGFNPKFFSQNPPASYLEEWASKEALFNIELIKHLPIIEWVGIDIKRVKKYRGDSIDYDLSVKFRNAGKLPTALKQADLVKIVRPDEARIMLDRKKGDTITYRVLDPVPVTRRHGGMMMYDEERQAPDYISKSTGYTDGGATSEAVFRIRVFGNAEVNGRASVSTTRAGVLQERDFVIR